MAVAGPCALITSCAADFAGEELVKSIIGTEDLAADVTTNGSVRFYPWTIDNKYYSADIHLCVVPNKYLVTAEIAESVQAFVAYFDSTIKSGLDSVSTWLPLAEEWLPEVMILVCDRVSENDDFPESTGVKRIIQALNANVWSNVVMKSDRNQGFGLLSTLAGANCSIGPEENQDTKPHPPPEDRAESHLDNRGDATNPNNLQIDSIVDPMLDMDIQELASLTTGEGDLENFERLFSKLKEMKDKAATLPHEQRKLHAEKVAKAFWMAIGGDRDEIEGLSSDDEN
ncbi:alpha- and gamma-adaptin-binding protein p34 isoform X2 [Emydura macquarii macquarii]|uniref:alpha- and gamma-adaptin-binding protein p34 isoform X2 n=1 Tax=Emydura macquarii macquarii TaxID=1129001 RepID=UPI00352A4C0E